MESTHERFLFTPPCDAIKTSLVPFFNASQLVNENHLAHFSWNNLYVFDRNYSCRENGELMSYLFSLEISSENFTPENFIT